MLTLRCEQRCLKDLRERFAKIEIQSSPPIVPFRETIVAAADMPPPKDPNLPRGTVVVTTPSKEITVRIRIRPLPEAVTEFLVTNANSIKAMYARKVAEEGAASEEDASATLRQTEAERKLLSIDQVKQGLQKAFAKVPAKEREVWQDAVERIVAFGPRRVGPNILLDGTEDSGLRKL